MTNGPPYRSIAVAANWFIQSLPSLTPLKLQKLIYYAHGWHLAIRNAPLIDEVIEAWEYGPVVPNVYHEFKKFGNRPIPTGTVGTMFEMFPTRRVRLVTPLIPAEDVQTRDFLKEIVGGVCVTTARSNFQCLLINPIPRGPKSMLQTQTGRVWKYPTETSKRISTV